MKRFIILVLSVFFCGMVNAQVNDEVLLTVAGEKITKTEFLNVYKKNNIKGDLMDKKSLDEYLNLYINFKLKVKESEELKLDTFTSFKNELAGYRKQLAQPYLTDKQVDDDLLKEAYDRLQWDIRASHILIKVNKDATPEDTLAAYKKVLKIRERLLKGEDFATVAKETSDDPSARDREEPDSKSIFKGNGGDLGYFSVLDMIYPFENGAYNTKVGQVSLPVRTDYGYHLIKVVNRKPAMGRAVVAHIFIEVPKDAKPENLATYKSKIDEAYAKLKGGETFENVVKEYSDDKGSAAKGGVLQGFGVNRMVPEFIEAVAKLNLNEYSEPVQTVYGWHIIKLIERTPVKSFDEEKTQLKARIIKDSRANKSKESVINRIMGEYGFKELPGVVNDFYAVVDSTIYEGKWEPAKAASLTKPMFTIGEKTITQQDFAKFLGTKQGRRIKMKITDFVNSRYDDFIDESCLQYEDSKLEQKYPEFKALMKEYRDGIMLFELTDKKVWSKAIQDTTGLTAFHENNKSKYMWDERLDASIFTCNNQATAKSARKLVKNYINGKMTEMDIYKKINIDTVPTLKIEHKKYSRKDNPVIDQIKWEKGVTEDISKDDKVIFVVVHNLVAPEPKLLKEAKGLITADYQNYLEEEWIKQLRSKYPYVVNQGVFDSLLK
ncbi:MAG TPA: peptidylprolyl isomerase [Bacteroidales bacterium]|nr:peptidylprolyl isomerase [Bacteroidales bacterium]HNZ43448.1 peptidylprolyl isomerase [Bacteroidales bacterium]HPB24281.1 peptidylprolyl isomerase [Bacteroidales bacterium]HPI28896.1 peptidylprolyl isomerase [Bacteroidales bacterium]HQN14876.1 peptidylprolyl isomerase [Bacteroidales bacterium]